MDIMTIVLLVFPTTSYYSKHLALYVFINHAQSMTSTLCARNWSGTVYGRWSIAAMALSPWHSVWLMCSMNTSSSYGFVIKDLSRWSEAASLKKFWQIRATTLHHSY